MTIHFHKKRYKIGAGILLVCVVYWLLCLPENLFDAPTSTVVQSHNERLLGARIADDGQWRFPEVDSVPRKFATCIRLFEDEYFFKHPGFNPVAISKAFWSNITTSDRRGASTLTQQVIRLSRNAEERTYGEKVLEICKATRLEVRDSKDEILRLYASHAPFGGNVVGLQTAAWRYFGVSASQLSWGQAAALAVLPNSPALIFPGKNRRPFKRKRDFLLKKLFENKIIDESTYELAVAEKLPGKPLALPDVASHLTEKVRRENNGKRLRSTIDYQLQQQINRLVDRYFQKLKQNKIHNVAVMVMQPNTKKVLAYVGNTKSGRQHSESVDIIQRSRSTGSILKPFLYASLFDDGRLLPGMLVRDLPTTIDGYSPKNFDQKYKGAVPARKALAYSLNVPAVRLLQDYGLERFYNKLKKTHQPLIDHSPGYYGLPLILGGAESSLWDVTNAYAGMASTLNYYQHSSSEYRPDEFQPPVYNADTDVEFGKNQQIPEIWSAGGISSTFKTLQHVKRPEGRAQWQLFGNKRSLAWKTGTSYGFKDAWAVGTTPNYTIGVWVGNADGEGRPGLVGIQAAAPVLFDVLELLPDRENHFPRPYDDLEELEVCKKSGFLAGRFCEETEQIMVPKAGRKSAVCPYHYRVFLNNKGQRVNSSCASTSAMQAQSWFSLPPAMEYFYRKSHPNYKALPPFKKGCKQNGKEIMQWISPQPHQAVILPKYFNGEKGEVVIRLSHRSSDEKVYWYLDGKYIGQTYYFHEMSLQIKPGNHNLSVVDGQGRELKRRLVVSD